MTTYSRQVVLGDTLALEVDIKDATGKNADADSTPQVGITDSSGVVQRAMSLIDVVHLSVGRYRLNYTVPVTGELGIWVDHWRAVLNGITTEAYLSFDVMSASAEITAAGDQIGDSPRITYSEEEIIGINILMAELKARLSNDVRVETVDAYGNTTYIECAVFTNEELTW